MKITALIVNILAILAIVLAAIAFIISGMTALSPGAENIKFLEWIFYCLAYLPLVLVVTNILGWIRFSKGDYRGAVFIYKWALLMVVMVGILFLAGKCF